MVESDAKQCANLCSQFAVLQASHDKEEEKKARDDAKEEGKLPVEAPVVAAGGAGCASCGASLYSEPWLCCSVCKDSFCAACKFPTDDDEAMICSQRCNAAMESPEDMENVDMA